MNKTNEGAPSAPQGGGVDDVLDVVARYVGKHSTIYGYIRDDLAAQPRTDASTQAAVKDDASFTATDAAQRPLDEGLAQAIGPEWSACRKRPVVVHVREQRADEQHVSTREGITPVKPDDLIMRGVEGEEYPIGRDLFNKTYDLVDEAQAQGGREACNCPGEGKLDPALHAPNCPARTAPPSAPAPVAGDAVAKLLQAWDTSPTKAGPDWIEKNARRECAHQLRAALAQDRASQAAAPSAPVGDGAREAFELWAAKRHGCALDRWADSGKYRYDNTNAWWECWQAALAQQPAAPSAPVGVE